MKKQSKERKSIVHLKVRELKELIENSVKSNENQKSEIDFEETLSKLNDSIIELNEEDLINLINGAISHSPLEKNGESDGKNSVNLLTRAEMAKELKISLPTLRKWTVKKIIPNHIKLGGFVYYDKQKVVDFLKAKK
jgi:DNA-binding transcriptional MerR regulator